MKIFNSLGRKLEDLVVGDDQIIRIYLCGPTVYDFAHLGHGRSAVNFDMIRKYLQLIKGYKVIYATNYTDIDDKMIDRAKKDFPDLPLKDAVEKLAEKIIPEYQQDYANLNITYPDIAPRATTYIAKMIEMVKLLAEKDMAYKLADGWYFDVSKFPEYAALSGQSLDDLKAGARIDLVSGKRNPQDFVLWKLRKNDDPYWVDTVLGDGRPGWHIECSAMIEEVFGGKVVDIHGGGEDLRFPHHDCEIAQSKSCFQHQFVKYWMHNAFVMVNNEKMSKSLNNFTTLRELFKTVEGDQLRFFYLQHHYRSPIDFHDAALDQAKNGLKRIHDCYSSLQSCFSVNEYDQNLIDILLSKTEGKLIECFDNDFDSGLAITELQNFVSEVNGILKNNNGLARWQVEMLLGFMSKWHAVFGFVIPTYTQIVVEKSIDGSRETDENFLKAKILMFPDDLDLEKIEAIKALVVLRDYFKSQKNFDRADEIRNFLLSNGVTLEDGKERTLVKIYNKIN